MRSDPAHSTLDTKCEPVDPREREFFIDDLLVRIHFIIEMIRWTGLAPWDFEFPFPGSLASIFLDPNHPECIHSVRPPPIRYASDFLKGGGAARLTFRIHDLSKLPQTKAANL